MLSQIIFSFCSVIALVAFEGSLTSVNPNVLNQLAQVLSKITALLASKHFYFETDTILIKK